MQTLIDQLYQLQDLYYLLSRSSAARLPLRDELIDEVDALYESDWTIEEIELFELPTISDFEEIDYMEYEEEGLNSDLLPLINFILSKFILEDGESSLVWSGIELRLEEESIINIIPLLIEYLQKLDYDFEYSIPIKRVNVDILVSVYLSSLDGISLLRGKGVKGGREITGSIKKRVSLEEALDIISNEDIYEMKSPFLGYSLGLGVISLTMIACRSIVDSIERGVLGFGWLLKLGRLIKYYNRAIYLLYGMDSLRVSYSLFLRDPNLKKRNNPSWNENIDPVVEEYEMYQAKSKIVNGYLIVDSSSLNDILALTLNLLESIYDDPVEEVDYLVDGIIFRRESKDILYLLNPLLNYYEVQHYDDQLDRFRPRARGFVDDFGSIEGDFAPPLSARELYTMYREMKSFGKSKELRELERENITRSSFSRDIQEMYERIV